MRVARGGRDGMGDGVLAGGGSWPRAIFFSAAPKVAGAERVEPSMETTVGKRRLAILDVKEPCTEDWGAMVGDARERHCALCEQSVYDLSEMTLDEAEALLARPGRTCVRFVRRADGRVTTKDCTPFRVRAARAATRATLGGAARLASWTLALLVLLGFGQFAGLDPVRWVGNLFGVGATMGEPMVMGAVPALPPAPQDEGGSDDEGSDSVPSTDEPAVD
ncbi:MAG: hypothetical protein CMN30_29785 [Sandaracinus sp.]|nr:hypothetical protein [Sandaracinus sp.]